jgi:hypothetical protein
MFSRTAITAVSISLLFSSCATLFNQSVQPVQINSNPSGLTFKVTNSSNELISTGVTPTSINLKTSAGYMRPESYTIVFSKKGKDFGRQNLTASISGWYFGNILIGGLIGLVIVDPLTGAMFTLQDDVTLNGAAMATLDHPSAGRLAIASIDQLSPAQRARLVRI